MFYRVEEVLTMISIDFGGITPNRKILTVAEKYVLNLKTVYFFIR